MFNIISDYRLVRSLESLKRDKVSRSRQYLDKVLGVHAEDYDFLVAFDAIVMSAECRHEDSLKRFRECMTLLDKKSDPDSRYIKLFCQYYACLYVEGGNCEQFRDQALSLDTGKRVRMFLRL